MGTTSNDPVITSYAKAPARTITAGGVTYAYRELGPKGGIPVIFFVHLAATLDNWDPRIIDPIAKEHHVIAFDNRGVGASTGQVPDSIEAMADDAYTFITRARLRHGRHLLLLPRRHGRPGPRGQASGAGSQADPHRDRPCRREGHRQGRRYDLLGHAARGPDPVGPEGVPVLQPQRHRQGCRSRVRQPARGAHRRPRRQDLGAGVPDAAQGDQEVGSLSPRRSVEDHPAHLDRQR